LTGKVFIESDDEWNLIDLNSDRNDNETTKVK
jgi:hypothetical protein